MNAFGAEKRKNDARRFPWRMLVLLAIGFALGVFVTLLVVPSRIETITYVGGNVDSIYITATYIIDQATQTAQALGTPPAQP